MTPATRAGDAVAARIESRDAGDPAPDGGAADEHGPRSERVWRRLLTAAVVLSAIVGAAVGGGTAWLIRGGFGVQQTPGQPVTAGGSAASVSAMAEQRAASVVSIATARVGVAGVLSGSVPIRSGFIVSADGLVVTSAHAVTGATALRVGTADGHVYDAVIVTAAPEQGFAILKLTGAHGLTPLTFATQSPRPGDLAVVVGRSPAGVDVGVGTVHAAGAVPAADGGAVGDALSADANVAVTDDGAPLIDGSGDVVGVAVVTGGGNSVMAASGAAVDRVVGDLTSSSPLPARFGLVAAPIDPAVAALLGVPVGALVVDVDPSGPAAGHLGAGDVVTAVNGTPVDGAHPLDAALQSVDPGGTATLAVFSGGSTTEVRLTVPSA